MGRRVAVAALDGPLRYFSRLLAMGWKPPCAPCSAAVPVVQRPHSARQQQRATHRPRAAGAHPRRAHRLASTMQSCFGFCAPPWVQGLMGNAWTGPRPCAHVQVYCTAQVACSTKYCFRQQAAASNRTRMALARYAALSPSPSTPCACAAAGGCGRTTLHNLPPSWTKALLQDGLAPRRDQDQRAGVPAWLTATADARGW